MTEFFTKMRAHVLLQCRANETLGEVHIGYMVRKELGLHVSTTVNVSFSISLDSLADYACYENNTQLGESYVINYIACCVYVSFLYKFCHVCRHASYAMHKL